jgi:hypothetical protein
MTVELVYGSVFWLNMFPSNDGVSDTISPHGLVIGLKLDYSKHCRIVYGAYAQTHEEHDTTMATRTTGAIALRPMGNDQGGYYFMSISTGHRLKRYQWTKLPMPKEVIDRVHTLARRSKANRDLTFTWRDGTIIKDEQDSDDDSDDDNSFYNATDGDAFSDSDESGNDESDYESDDESNNDDADDADDDALSLDDENMDEDDNQVVNPIDAPFTGVVGDEDEDNEDENIDEGPNNGIEAADDNNEPPVLDETHIISEDEGASADKDDDDDSDNESNKENKNNEVAPVKTAGVRFSENEVAPAGDPGVSNPEQVAAEMDAQYGHCSGQYVL